MRQYVASIACMCLLASVAPGQWRNAPEQARESPGLFQTETQDHGHKSILLAVGLSLVLPGAGEWYANNLATGQYFMGADALLWLTYAGFVLQSNWTRNDAHTFAAQHAGASFQGKDDQFDVNLGNYSSSETYNQARLRSRENDLLYSAPGSAWTWDSEPHRLTYKDLRIRSDEQSRDARFVVGAIVVNRIVSAFSAWRSVSRYNRDLAAASGWDARAEVDGGVFQPQGITVRLSKSF